MVSNNQNFIINKFEKTFNKSLNLSLIKNLISALPRPLIETISLFFLVIILYSYVEIFKINTSEALVRLSVYFVCILRLGMPSFTSISSSYAILKFNKPSVELIFNETINVVATKNLSQNNLKVLSLRDNQTAKVANLSFGYSTSNQIINNFNLTLNEGEFINIKGKSGSGKSTLILLLCGLLKPNKGEIIINEKY